MMLTTRIATPEDAPAITRIYNQGIDERIATFETEPRTVEQISAQLCEKGDHYPTVVVERDGEIVAWAGFGSYRSRPCYRKAGFSEVGVYRRHGKLDGERRDCVIVEKLIGEARAT